MDLNLFTPIAVDLALIELFKHIGIDQERSAVAMCVISFYEGNDPSWIVLDPPVVMRSLPKTAFPAPDVGAARLSVAKSLTPSQRAVAKQPNRTSCVDQVTHEEPVVR